MKVLVAGASSVLGLPTLRELLRRGHETYGLTRSRRNGDIIAANGATAISYGPRGTATLCGEVHSNRDCDRALASLDRFLEQRGSAGGRPYAFDPEIHRRRNAVERAFNRFNAGADSHPDTTNRGQLPGKTRSRQPPALGRCMTIQKTS